MKLSAQQLDTLYNLAKSAGEKGNLPNGSLLLDGAGSIVYQAESAVASSHDATAHAELFVISRACRAEQSPLIRQYVLVTIIEPCLMCLSAAYWAGISKIYYIIPASNYWDAIPWMAESRTIDKQGLIAQWNETIKLVRLPAYEKKFSDLFEMHERKVIPRS